MQSDTAHLMTENREYVAWLAQELVLGAIYCS